MQKNQIDLNEYHFRDIDIPFNVMKPFILDRIKLGYVKQSNNGNTHYLEPKFHNDSWDFDCLRQTYDKRHSGNLLFTISNEWINCETCETIIIPSDTIVIHYIGLYTPLIITKGSINLKINHIATATCQGYMKEDVIFNNYEGSTPKLPLFTFKGTQLSLRDIVQILREEQHANDPTSYR